jgi:hypothetical protein
MRILIGLVVLAVAVPASANLLTNGGFEDGTNAWTIATFWHAGWGSDAPVLSPKNAPLGTFGGLGIPHEGAFSLATDISGHANFHVGAYQTVATVPGVTYTVSGWFAGGVESTSSDTNWWEILAAHGTTSNPDAAGTVIAKKERAAGGEGMSFQESFSNTFVAEQTTTTLFLKWGASSSADWRIRAAAFDSLSIVPEPAALGLLVLGLPLLRRRR